VALTTGDIRTANRATSGAGGTVLSYKGGEASSSSWTRWLIVLAVVAVLVFVLWKLFGR
jgi:hypothetical protein